MTDEQIIEAFHAMWDNFPEPVMLIQKSREIIALNQKCAESGLQPGIKCSSVGSPEQHRGCLCNKAIETQKGIGITYSSPFGKAFGYWIPVTTKPEWIIHFGIGANFDYEAPKTIVTEIKG